MYPSGGLPGPPPIPRPSLGDAGSTAPPGLGGAPPGLMGQRGPSAAGMAAPQANGAAGLYPPRPHMQPGGRQALSPQRPQGLPNVGVPASFPGAPHSGAAAPGLGPYPGMPRPGGAQPMPGMRPQGDALAAARPGAGPRPAAAAAPAVKCDWTEHKAPDGRFYYHNAKTKESVWVKPPELEAAQAAARKAAEAAAAAKAAKAADPLAACPWKEFKAPDGRKYYHNRETKMSVWTVPEELVRAREAAAAAVARGGDAAAVAAAAAAAAAPAAAPAATEAPAGNSKYMYATKEDAKSAFKALLKDSGVWVEERWEKVLKKLEALYARGDRRFAALNSNKERQSCFKEWIADEKAAQREEERRKAEEARAQFMQLLDSKSSMMGPGARFSKCEALCFEDPRWELLTPDRRAEAFKAWMDEREAAAAAREAAEREEKLSAFRQLLASTPAITVGTTWRKAEELLHDERLFRDLPGKYKLDVWEAFLKELHDQEEVDRRDAELARQRQERKNRDAFKQLLSRHREQGIINAKTRWKRYRELIRKEEEYLAMENNARGSRPKELFLDALMEMEDRFDKDKLRMKEALAAARFTVTQDTEYTEMMELLEREEADDPKLREVLDVNKRLYYEELVGKSKEREQKESKRRKKARHEFASGLKHRHIKADMTWEEARAIMVKDPSYKALDNDDDAEAVFCEYVAKLREKRSRESKLDKKDRKERERERDHKRKARDDGDGSEEPTRDDARGGGGGEKRARKSAEHDGGARGDREGGDADGDARDRRSAPDGDAERGWERDRERSRVSADASMSPPHDGDRLDAMGPLPPPPQRPGKNSHDGLDGSYEEGEV